MENTQNNSTSTTKMAKVETIIKTLFNLNTNTSLFFVSLLMVIYVFSSRSIKTVANVGYLDSVGIGIAPYTDFVFWDYFKFFKYSPFTIVPFFIALAPIPFLRKVLSSIILFIVAILGTFTVLGSFFADTGEYNLYLVSLQVFIKQFSLYFFGCYLVAFLIGSLLYYFLLQGKKSKWCFLKAE